MGAVGFTTSIPVEVLVAAGAVVPTGFVVPQRKIVAGNPARVQGEMSEMHEQFRRDGISLYQELPERYRRGLVKITDGG